MKYKLSLKNPILGIITEVIYSLYIMLVAYVLCVVVLLKKWF